MSKEFGETDHLRSQVGNSGGFWQTPSAERPEFPGIVQRYASASAFRNALLARCRDAARKDKRFNSVTRLNLFTFDRFLARVFQHPEVRPDSWAVKGGTSLIARLQEARSSKVLDMSVRESLDDAVRIIKEAIQSNLNDYLAFEITQKRKAADGKGRKFQVVATCGARELATFELDLSVATSFPDNLDDTAPLPGVDFTGLPRNTYPAWPMDRVVADKVAAVFEDHNGKSSTRYRDLVDLYLLQAQVGFDSLQLRETLRAEMGRRNLQVPGEFKVPNEAEWSRGWSMISVEDLPLLRSVKFKVGLTAVKRFIDPVLIGTAEGRWDPTQGFWT